MSICCLDRFEYRHSKAKAKAKREYEKARVWDLIGQEAKSVSRQEADNSNDKEDTFTLEEDDPVLREFRQQVRPNSRLCIARCSCTLGKRSA